MIEPNSELIIDFELVRDNIKIIRDNLVENGLELKTLTNLKKFN